MEEPTLRRLVARKRDGGRITREWTEILAAQLAGSADEAALAALLMACVLNGLDRDETLALTRALIASGETLALPFPFAVDKHSTGGVADLGSLVVAPIVAACGVPVAKLAGRALGHTGGTIDKLEAVPGVRTALSTEEFVATIRTAGCAIASQTAALVPGDRAMYALRDRTGTVPSAGLIAASVVSKKIAGGANAIVYDVKCGGAAFMRTRAEAEGLARLLVDLTRALGRTARALVTEMDEPLGRAIGTGLEAIEAREVLAGTNDDPRVRRVCGALACALLEAAGVLDPRARVADALASGAAADRFARMLSAQGARRGALAALAPHPRRTTMRARRTGSVAAIDAVALGELARDLVARSGPTAGLVLRVRRGERLAAGDPLAEAYGDAAATQALARGVAAFALADAAEPPGDPVLAEIR